MQTKQHEILETINYFAAFYKNLSDGCFHIIPIGTVDYRNYESSVFLSMHNTLGSLKMILEENRINDAFVLTRKLFDDVLCDIYISLKRLDEGEDKLESETFARWRNEFYRMPKTSVILKEIKTNRRTASLYKLFDWDDNSFYNKYRESLNASLHNNIYLRYVINCPDYVGVERLKYLDVLNEMLLENFRRHIAFLLLLCPDCLASSDYMDYLEMGDDPINGSQYWLAPYFQEAYDKLILPYRSLDVYLREASVMDIGAEM